MKKAIQAFQSSWWEMGLLDESDWTGDWLAAEDGTIADDRAAGLHWIWGEKPDEITPRGIRLFPVSTYPGSEKLEHQNR